MRSAAAHAAAAGCEWLHVDFRAELAPFYFDACGFTATAAGLIHLDPGHDGSASDADGGGLDER